MQKSEFEGSSSKEFETLKSALSYLAPADITLVEKAFKHADKLHKGVKRVSGDPFITHPLHVAFTLAKLHLDAATICAALLHDTVEDTPYSLGEIKRDFSEEVAMLVDGVTKITRIKYSSVEESDAEAIRKLLMASIKDIRVIVIKLADKLHNMRTIQYLSEERQVRIARDALNIYAPLAYRLGLASIKWEIEDLCFKVLEPDVYQKFKLRFGKTRKDREGDIEKIKSELESRLKEAGIPARIVGRPKHFYSIYKKMITRGRSFEEVNDLIALRVITNSVRECYEVLGVIHNGWPPIPGKFKDYIATPKSNFYQSLHTSVVAFEQPVEFQIRTEEMHEVAEEGIAAHWKYKRAAGDSQFDKKMSWLRDILEWQQNSSNTAEFVDFLKVDLFDDQVHAMTPHGDVVSLPKGSSPIDFAYKIHTSIGDRCQGAIVNARLVPLKYELKTGDIVKILTGKTVAPKRDWLKFVKTPLAKSKIRQYLREKGELPLSSASAPPPEQLVNNTLVEIDGDPHAKVKLARCCRPVPDEPISAHVSARGMYAVHRMNCEKLGKRTEKKIVSAWWNDLHQGPVLLKVVAEDRLGIFTDILSIIARYHVHVDPATAKSIGNGYIECDLGFTPSQLEIVGSMAHELREKVRGVHSAYITEALV